MITIAVPSFNQASFLNDALTSIYTQELPVEVFVADGGSTDGSLEIIQSWEHRLAGWRSHSDAGQAAAINECIRKGTAPFVCWLNSDDWFLPGGLSLLLKALERNKSAPVAYGRCMNFIQRTGRFKPIWVESFNVNRLAVRCIISQPGTLIRRSAWESVRGLNEDLHMAMDYDLWWRLFGLQGEFSFVSEFVAVNRDHAETKTNTQRRRHYSEAMGVVRKYYGRVPIKWWLGQPYAVWFRSLL